MAALKYANGIEDQDDRHKHWIALEWNDSENYHRIRAKGKRLLKRPTAREHAFCKCTDGCSSARFCRKFKDGCLHQCSCRREGKACISRWPQAPAAEELEKRAASIRASGEDCIDEHPRLFRDYCQSRTSTCGTTKLSHVGGISQLVESFDGMRKLSKDMWDSHSYKSYKEEWIWHLHGGP